ncbi:MAG: haloacid dehalogenase type II [Pseudobdellovibrionaceae bacterium]
MNLNFRSATYSIIFLLMLMNSSAGQAVESTAPKVKAVVIDYFALFDMKSVYAECDNEFQKTSPELCRVWRGKQLEYGFMNVIAKRPLDFQVWAGDALDFAADSTKTKLTPSTRKKLLNSYSKLEPWPDTVDALKKLKKAGVRLAVVTFLSSSVQRANAKRAGIEKLFDSFISTEKKHDIRPSPLAYAAMEKELQLKKDQIVYVASAYWDVFGAKSFGFTTYLVNRTMAPADKYGVAPDKTFENLESLVPVLSNSNKP